MNLIYSQQRDSREYWQRIRERERYRREVEIRRNLQTSPREAKDQALAQHVG